MSNAVQTPRSVVCTELVGHVGKQVAHLLPVYCGVLGVHVTPGVVAHYREKHGAQMDVAYAEQLLPLVLDDPMGVYQGKKRTTLVFVGQYSARFLLIAPLKCGRGRIWQETLYKAEIVSFLGRGWVRNGCLYTREG